MRKRTLCYFLMVALCFTFLSGALAAEKYPAKEIQLVMSNPPGGSMTIVIQLLKESLEKSLGVPVVLNYQTGGSGAAGVAYLAKAKPDGYTIGSFTSREVITLPATVPGVPYKYSDLESLCKYTSVPSLIFVKGDAPWKTVEELVADAKKRPGEITYGATTKSISHMLMEDFLKAAGIKMLHVPTEAAGQTITRILGGNLDVGIVAVAPAVGQLKAGKLRGLFVSPDRVAIFPKIPTLKEKGFHDPVLNLYSGFFAPLRIPKPILQTLEKALEKAIKDPAFKNRLESEALVWEYVAREAFAQEVQEDYTRVMKNVKPSDPRK